jgi:hypothetical protein
MSVKNPGSFEFDAQTGRHNTLEILAGAASVTALAALVGHNVMVQRERRESAVAEMYIRPGPTDKRLIFAQFGVNTRDLPDAIRFHSHFGHLGTVAIPLHPNVGVPVQAMKQAVVDTRRQHGEAATVMYGHSFGGFLNGVMLDDPDFRSAMGSISLMIWDNSFSSFNAIARRGKLLLEGANRLPHSWAIAHAPHVSSPLYHTAEQYRFITHHKIEEGSLEGSSARVICIQPANDPMVQNDVAYEGIQRAYGDQPVERLIDASRTTSTHEGAIYYPDLIQKLIAAVQADPLVPAAA